MANNRNEEHHILSFPGCYSPQISFAMFLKHREAITGADMACKLAAVLRCEDPKCVPSVGCIITPVECVGAPLICSQLTESGPVSEAAQAALMKRLTAFELLSITKVEAATRPMQRNYGE